MLKAEPVLIWESVCMPTGSGKSPLCSHITKLLDDVKQNLGDCPQWQVGDATFEKWVKHRNSSRIFGMYDELTTFYQGKGLSNSHELASLILATIQWACMAQKHRYVHAYVM